MTNKCDSQDASWTWMFKIFSPWLILKVESQNLKIFQVHILKTSLTNFFSPGVKYLHKKEFAKKSNNSLLVLYPKFNFNFVQRSKSSLKFFRIFFSLFEDVKLNDQISYRKFSSQSQIFSNRIQANKFFWTVLSLVDYEIKWETSFSNHTNTVLIILKINWRNVFKW